MGLQAHFLRKKGSWYVGLLVYPEFWGSFVWFTMYIQLGTRTATGGWPRACLEHGPGKQAPLMTTVIVRGSLDTNC